MVMKKKGEVIELIESNVLYELEGDIDDAINEIKSLKKEYGEKYKTLFFEKEENSYYNSESYTVLALYGIRDETEKEIEKRLKVEKKRQEDLEKKEREELEKLQKKYAKNV